MPKNSKAASPGMAATMGDTAAKTHDENTHFTSDSQTESIIPKLTGNQTSHLLTLLISRRKINTIQARRLGINHVAGRTNDFRKQGVTIETHWTKTADQQGKIVKVALYVLSNNPQLFLPGFDIAKKGGIGACCPGEDQQCLLRIK